MQPDSERRNEILDRLWQARQQQSARFTPELLKDLDGFSTADCAHDGRHSIIRYRVNGGGSQTRKCCETCGDVFGGAVRPLGKIPDWDAGKLVMWVERRITAMRAIFERHAGIQAAQLNDMRANHAAYLQSPEWRARRQRVMERAAGLCEGCRSRKATQVHHLTYKHWARELLFELVALCDDCHAICHEDRKETA